MFQPEPVARDKYGCWLHSALRVTEEEDLTKLPEAEGMEFRFVSFEDDAPEELQTRYERGTGSLLVEDEVWMSAVREWEPTVPEGEGWFLLGIYDTEDGPYACFTRPRM